MMMSCVLLFVQGGQATTGNIKGFPPTHWTPTLDRGQMTSVLFACCMVICLLYGEKEKGTYDIFYVHSSTVRGLQLTRFLYRMIKTTAGVTFVF